jgi:hypothetical protein
MILYESEIEEIALRLLRDENGYAILYGPDLLECAPLENGYNYIVHLIHLRVTMGMNQTLVQAYS